MKVVKEKEKRKHNIQNLFLFFYNKTVNEFLFLQFLQLKVNPSIIFTPSEVSNGTHEDNKAKYR